MPSNPIAERIIPVRKILKIIIIVWIDIFKIFNQLEIINIGNITIDVTDIIIPIYPTIFIGNKENEVIAFTAVLVKLKKLYLLIPELLLLISIGKEIVLKPIQFMKVFTDLFFSVKLL